MWHILVKAKLKRSLKGKGAWKTQLFFYSSTHYFISASQGFCSDITNSMQSWSWDFLPFSFRYRRISANWKAEFGANKWQHCTQKWRFGEMSCLFSTAGKWIHGSITMDNVRSILPFTHKNHLCVEIKKQLQHPDLGEIGCLSWALTVTKFNTIYLAETQQNWNTHQYVH